MPSTLDQLVGEVSPRSQLPRTHRASVLLNAAIQRFGTLETTNHRVRDLSPGGMRVDQADRLHRGATVLVTVGALEAIGATVAWVDGGWAGLKFAEAINPEEARARAAITPASEKLPGRSELRSSATPLKAGWADDIRNPYRRR